MATTHLGRLPRFSTIGPDERREVMDSLLRGPLSGYIGGNPRGGYWTDMLERKWKEAFDVEAAIPCNSATSGLLAACMAIGVRPGDEIWTTPYSMSATAACAKVLGAKLRFIDIETRRFGIDPAGLFGWSFGTNPRAIIVTNLFGHPAYLVELKTWCDAHNIILIEDNAQAPMAIVNDRYTGTIGDIGVFSLNVHKHIQCGEGGVVVTDNHVLAQRLRGCINHGELDLHTDSLGLNLRMTEPIAAIACAQLKRAKAIIEGRRQIGLELCYMVQDIPWIKAHTDQPGCRHVYYLWTALIDSQKRRDEFVRRLAERGFPIRGGYAPLLHRLFNAGGACPVVEDIDSRIVVVEVCAHDFGHNHLRTMDEIIQQVAGEMDEDRAA